jgi:hypothetical protein
MADLDEQEVADHEDDRRYDSGILVPKTRFTQFFGLPILSWVSLVLGSFISIIVWFSDSYF